VVEILSLPRSLTKIDFKFEGDLASFAKALSLQPDHFSDLKCLYLSAVEFKIGSFVTLGHLIPHGLQEFRVKSWQMLDLEDANPVVSIEVLPPTLTNLCIAVPTLDKLAEGMLPQTLNSFEVLLSYSYSDWIKFLPPGLRTCIVHSNRGDYSAALLDWSALPRGLTWFETEMYSEDMLELRHVLALPPGLTQLHLESDSKDKIDHRLIRHLPRSLTSANLWGSLSVEEFVDLPPALTSLRAPSSALSLLPVAVTDLSIVDKAQYWPKDVHIPSTVVSLDLEDLPNDILPILPPMLQSLAFDNGMLTKRILCGLPNTLTSITTASEQPFTSEAMFKFLPPNLT
jgi:hypothetical protein